MHHLLFCPLDRPDVTPHQAEVLATSSEGKPVKRYRLLQWPEAITPESRDAWSFLRVLTCFDRQGQ